jgi:hypothetical protein
MYPWMERIMSRIEFISSDNQEISGGWDSATRKFFLTIFENHEPTLNIDSESIEELKAILSGLEIEAPDGFWELVSGPKMTVLRWKHKECIWG